MGRLQRRFGVDLGTCNTIIYKHGKGIVLQEPSVVAVNRDTGEIAAFGEEAKAMIGRTPANLEVVYPLQDGVIANFDMTTAMLKHFIGKIQKKSWFGSTQVFISVPCGVTNVQRRAVEETALQKGSGKTVAIEEPLAAAIGAGLPVTEPTGCMVLDIGGGTSQVAVISLGGIVVSRYVRRGGMSIDRDIIDYVKRTHNVLIGERTAEDIKKNVATVIRPTEDVSMDIRGRDLVNGLPKTITIKASEIYDLLNEFILVIVDHIRQAIEECPPELAGDVMERGILLCGGGALLQGMDQRLQAETGVPVNLADQPLECVALGAGQMLTSVRN